jgi:hypothetical protein
MYRMKATLQSDDGKTWKVFHVDYLTEKKIGREKSEFISHDHCMEWKFELIE